MAKKQQPKLSYGPNMGLIAGEAAVAGSEAGLTNVGGAFAQGFTNVFAAYQKEEEERDAKMEAYAAQFPGLEQVNFMANATNKQVVTDFLNTQRDEYVKLAETYEKTKDRAVLDKMNAIKFSIANLDDQIKVFNEDKKEYRTAFDEDQLADGQVYDKDFYTNIFTNNAKFSVTESGDISFDVTGKKNKSNLYKDHAGNWTNRNNISESAFLEMYSKAQATGEKGDAFYRDTTYRALLSSLKATGNEGLQTFVTTDLTGDKSDFTFQQQWARGELDDKFYKGRKKEDGTDWMFDNKNAGELRKLVADYYTDVVEDGYNIGKKNYTPPVSEQKRIDKANELFGAYTDTGGDYEFGIKPSASIPREDKEDRYRSLLALDGFTGVHYAYEWNGKNWEAYSLDGEKEKVKDLNGGQVARIEGLKTRNESVFNDFIISSEDVETKKENTPPSPGELSLGDVKAYKTGDIKSNFSKVFKPALFKDYDFKTVVDDYNDLTKLVIRPEREGLPTVPIFTIGDEATKDTAAEITKFFSDYLIMDTSYSDKT